MKMTLTTIIILLFAVCLTITALANDKCKKPPKLPGCEKPLLTYGPGNPTEISIGQPADIKVTGGAENYHWSLSDTTNYTLATPTTTDQNNDSCNPVSGNQVTAINACNPVTVTITDDSNPTQTISGYLNTDMPPLTYDPNNPTEMTPNSATVIHVISGVGPYTWTISGNDYGFDDQCTIQTIDDGSGTATQTIYACNCATGAAQITITDACNESVNGSVAVNVDPLTYIYDPPADQEATAGDPALVVVSGGYPPYTYTLTDSNFSFNPSLAVDSTSTDSPSIEVYNISNGCVTDVQVEDDCQATVSGQVSGADWVEINHCSEITEAMSGACSNFDATAVQQEITGANAVWVTDGGGNKLYREEESENFKVIEYYDNGQSPAFNCSFGFSSCACYNSWSSLCDFWLMGDCATYSGTHETHFPCCASQCLKIQDRYVYEKSCP